MSKCGPDGKITLASLYMTIFAPGSHPSTYSYFSSYLSQDGNIIRSDDISLDWMECPFILENI